MKFTIPILCLLFLGMSACQTEDSTPLPTVISITHTPSEVPPSPTALIANTLPPVQTIVIPTITPAATRTLAATLTPAPTRTPDQINSLNLPEVQRETRPEEAPPAEEGNFGDLAKGPILQIRYGEITTRLLEVNIPLSTDTIASDTLQLTYSDTGAVLRFEIVQAIEEPNLDITVPVIFSFRPEEGRIEVSLEKAYQTANPAQVYEGGLLVLLAEELQNALDTVIANSFERRLGESIPFVVTGFAESSSALSIETGVAN